ncbi:MAG: hypothetical protein OES09_07545 [Gammaproteobacteria bacterium]|nr:hypothetical protein [Gammaproteobacteria bacterium]
MKALLVSILVLAVQFSVFGAACASQRHLLIVGGLGGEPQYAKLFNEWVVHMAEIAERGLGLARERVTLVSGYPEDEDSTPRKEDILAALDNTAKASAPGDLVMLMLIGHGTARNGRALFNLPGPDLSAAELTEQLKQFRGRSLVIVNAASSSGPFVQELSAEGRVVITATASGSENQFAYFGGHFIGAFVADIADADKDGRVSLLEAFNHARRAVARAYEDDDRLLTEHALLDDNGDGIGSRLTEVLPADGVLAAKLYLQPGISELAGGGVHAREMLALDVQASELVNRIDRLKRRRHQLLDEEYYRELESLLVTLAYNRREFRGARNARATPHSL